MSSKWLLGKPVIENMLQDIVVESVKENAKFQHESGMRPKIIRRSSGNCCEWCDKVAGTYTYPDVPKDVYRRHKNCDCTVEYDPGDGKKQNVWSKEWKEDAKILQKRKIIGLENVEESTNSGIISVEIDEFVPCLKNAKTGEIVDTVSVRIINPKDLIDFNEKTGWFIDWADEIAVGNEVYAIKIKGEKIIQGLLSLKKDTQNSAVYGNWIVAAPHNRGAAKSYIGVGGHLFALAGQKSIDYGFDGFFWGKAANQKLYKYYLDVFDGVPIDPSQYTFYIDENAMKKIVDIYNFEKE